MTGKPDCLLLNDCGLVGRLKDGRVVSSQWIDPLYKCDANDSGWEVKGQLQVVPSNKLFTPLKNLLFRAALVSLGWLPAFSHLLKARIRKALILGQRAVPIRFQRRLQLNAEGVTLRDEVVLEGSEQFLALSIGGEFFVRYVPQSRYFQAQELETYGSALHPDALHTLNSSRQIKLEQVQEGSAPSVSSPFGLIENSAAALPAGVYDVDYHLGRRQKRQLVYRLQRRTAEVETALQRHMQGRLRTVVDVGTADGLMLEMLRQRLGPVTLIGLDYSLALLRTTDLPAVHKVQGDALALPFKSGSTDALIATAVLEHVPDASAALRECARILRPGGLLVVTTPDPLLEHLSSMIGLLKETGHQETFTLAKLRVLVEASGFTVVESRKFMFSPIGFPAERAIERILNAGGFSWVMANQLLIARKIE